MWEPFQLSVPYVAHHCSSGVARNSVVRATPLPGLLAGPCPGAPSPPFPSPLVAELLGVHVSDAVRV